MQIGRHRAGRAGLLSDQAELADLHRLGRVAKIVDFGHAARAPGLHAGDHVGDAGVALPPALMGVLQAVELGDQFRRGRIGHVPDLVPDIAVGAQQVDRVAVAPRQARAVAQAHHLGAAVLGQPLRARQVVQVFGLRRIGDVEDRGAVELRLPVHRVDRLGNRGGAAVMADIGDPAVALAMDQRLVSAARLQVVVAHEAHVLGLGRVADLLHLCRSGQAEKSCRGKSQRSKRKLTSCHRHLPSGASCGRPSCKTIKPCRVADQQLLLGRYIGRKKRHQVDQVGLVGFVRGIGMRENPCPTTRDRAPPARLRARSAPPPHRAAWRCAPSRTP